MTTLQVVVHEPGPAWQPGIAFREQRGVEHHIATMRGWLEEGRLVMGGPFLDAEGGGMAVVAFDSLEAADAAAQADRAVRDGLLRARTREWLVGAAMSSMTGLIVSTVANLVLDVLFILVLGWGVAGAALAVGLSNLVLVAFYAWWLIARSTVASLSPRQFRADREMLRTVFGVGVSELLMASFLVVSALLLNWVAGSYGEAVIASFGVAQRIAQLPEMLCMGVFMGVLPLLGFAFGAGDRARLRAGIRSSALAIGGITLVFTTGVFLFRDQILGMFSADPAVLTDGALILAAMLVSTIFNGFTGLFIAVFQATEQMRNATIMAVAQGLLFAPILLVMSHLLGLTGVIWALTAAEVATFALGAVLLTVSRGALDRGAVDRGAGVVAGSVGPAVLAPAPA